MKIIGVDPGSRRIGIGIIERRGSSLYLLKADLLPIQSTNDADALLETKEGLMSLLKEFTPDIFAIEKLYFSNNQKTAFQVAQSRGVLIMCASEFGLPVYEYSPNEVKLGIAGYGMADKKAVAKMVRLTLKIDTLHVVDDVTDALAIAIVAAGKALLEKNPHSGRLK